MNLLKNAVSGDSYVVQLWTECDIIMNHKSKHKHSPSGAEENYGKLATGWDSNRIYSECKSDEGKLCPNSLSIFIA
jgi:hypothetical protein